MYEGLVAEYLASEIPPYVRRKNALGELPIPQRRNLIMAIIGVRRCGKTFQLFQAMNELMRSGVSRELFFLLSLRRRPPGGARRAYSVQVARRLLRARARGGERMLSPL